MSETLPATGKKSWLDFFKPAPPAAVKITNPARIKIDFASWQVGIMIGTLVGYALFYFVRKNLSSAMAGPTGMLKVLNITKEHFGIFLTMHGLVYGFSKFINGFIADRANAAKFMTLALLLSAGANIAFGLSSTLWVLGTLWVLNGWFQGMGFPPIARLMTHWFSPKELATKMSLWNTSHSIGAGLVAALCGVLVKIDWRLCFFVPAGLAIAFALILPWFLRDNPQSVGLPDVMDFERQPAPIPFTKILIVIGQAWLVTIGVCIITLFISGGGLMAGVLFGIGSTLFLTGKQVGFFFYLLWSGISLVLGIFHWITSVRKLKASQIDDFKIDLAANKEAAAKETFVEDTSSSEYKAFVRKQIFGNKFIWLLAIANFFVYVIRFGIFDWGMILLTETKHMDVADAGFVLMGFEFSGVLGMLVTGWMTDRFFGGRCARMCMFAMALAGLAILVFWQTPIERGTISVIAFCLAGFFIYSPQALIGIASANLATKRAAATAVGFTGLFGYLSTLLSGWGFGLLVQKAGWNAGLVLLIACAAIGTVLFAMAWGAKASGYADEPRTKA